MKSKRKAVYLIYLISMLLITTIVFEILRDSISDYYRASKIISLYSIFVFISIELIIYKIEKHINFILLFIPLCFIFLFGQCYDIWIYNYIEYNSIFSIVNVIPPNSVFEISFYTMFCIILMSILYFVSSYYGNRKIGTRKKDRKKYIYSNSIFFVGVLLLCVSIIPTFYLCFKDIKNLKLYGYASTLIKPTGIDKLLNIFKGLFNSSLVMILISDRKKKNIAYIILFLYLTLEVVGGTRIQAFRFLILLILLFFEENKTNVKHMIILMMCLFTAACVFELIAGFRGGQANAITFLDLSKKNGGKSLLYNIIFECGHTQCLISVVYSMCPSIVGYQHGLSILRSISSALPNIGFWSTHPALITVDTVFSPLYTNKTGLGGSIFATVYWNFGYIGGIIAIGLFGIVISKITKSIYNTNSACTRYICYYLVYYLVFLVRGDIEQFGRTFIFYILFPIMLVKIYNHYVDKNKNDKVFDDLLTKELR